MQSSRSTPDQSSSSEAHGYSQYEYRHANTSRHVHPPPSFDSTQRYQQNVNPSWPRNGPNIQENVNQSWPRNGRYPQNVNQSWHWNGPDFDSWNDDGYRPTPAGNFGPGSTSTFNQQRQVNDQRRYSGAAPKQQFSAPLLYVSQKKKRQTRWDSGPRFPQVPVSTTPSKNSVVQHTSNTQVKEKTQRTDAAPKHHIVPSADSSEHQKPVSSKVSSATIGQSARSKKGKSNGKPMHGKKNFPKKKQKATKVKSSPPQFKSLKKGHQRHSSASGRFLVDTNKGSGSENQISSNNQQSGNEQQQNKSEAGNPVNSKFKWFSKDYVHALSQESASCDKQITSSTVGVSNQPTPVNTTGVPEHSNRTQVQKGSLEDQGKQKGTAGPPSTHIQLKQMTSKERKRMEHTALKKAQKAEMHWKRKIQNEQVTLTLSTMDCQMSKSSISIRSHTRSENATVPKAVGDEMDEVVCVDTPSSGFKSALLPAQASHNDGRPKVCNKRDLKKNVACVPSSEASKEDVILIGPSSKAAKKKSPSLSKMSPVCGQPNLSKKKHMRIVKRSSSVSKTLQSLSSNKQPNLCKKRNITVVVKRESREDTNKKGDDVCPSNSGVEMVPSGSRASAEFSASASFVRLNVSKKTVPRIEMTATPSGSNVQSATSLCSVDSALEMPASSSSSSSRNPLVHYSSTPQSTSSDHMAKNLRKGHGTSGGKAYTASKKAGNRDVSAPHPSHARSQHTSQCPELSSSSDKQVQISDKNVGSNGDRSRKQSKNQNVNTPSPGNLNLKMPPTVSRLASVAFDLDGSSPTSASGHKSNVVDSCGLFQKFDPSIPLFHSSSSPSTSTGQEKGSWETQKTSGQASRPPSGLTTGRNSSGESLTRLFQKFDPSIPLFHSSSSPSTSTGQEKGSWETQKTSGQASRPPSGLTTGRNSSGESLTRDDLSIPLSRSSSAPSSTSAATSLSSPASSTTTTSSSAGLEKGQSEKPKTSGQGSKPLLTTVLVSEQQKQLPKPNLTIGRSRLRVNKDAEQAPGGQKFKASIYFIKFITKCRESYSKDKGWYSRKVILTLGSV